MAKEWYPIINREACVGCLTCVEFCPHNVYQVEDGKPAVVNPDNCVEFCQGCGKICPTGAIGYFGKN
ncbi:MAG TPA: ferredoxin family protein [Candidatus Acetothermia bacterium]|nr:ferredoxin family protein [Candidatus Bipolaricaulota bacterium]HDO74648.1 ferredoxin family protein [Candidatus Acetothermia bacterium]HEX32590.1 ferredoxin family protein [Candidatus Acetothermia bacterium]